MSDEIIICGSTCGHNHDSLNGPTGCCAKHGPYMYFCSICHEEYLLRRPPEGWDAFGTHAVLDQVPFLEFSEQTGEDGLPLWERPLQLFHPNSSEKKDGKA